jgi:negative regulator of flagellin synthesis FlgM
MGDIIGVNGFFQALPVDYLAGPATGERARSGSGTASPPVSSTPLADEVEVSTLGNLLSRMSEAPGIRLGRIAKIRAAIAAGTYETPAKISTVVDRLLDRIED